MTNALAQACLEALVSGEDILPEALFGEDDWKSFWQVRHHLVQRAIDAAKHRGRSYRDFRVGAAAFVSCQDPELMRSLGRTPQHIYTGANWKLGADERNHCAEQEVVSQIRQQQHLFPAKEVLALVVAGLPLGEPDRASGLMTAALHPCNHCRKLLVHTQEMQLHTLIILANPETGRQEYLTFATLLAQHGEHASCHQHT